MSDNEILVVRHGKDKQGDPFTVTYELQEARDGFLIIGRHSSSHPPKQRYTPAEFVKAGYHLQEDCGHHHGNKCDRPRYHFGSHFDNALDQ